MIFRKTTSNFNLPMMKAAKCAIVEVEEIVEPGQLDPDFIHVSGVYVKRLLKGAHYEKPIERLMVKGASAEPVNPVRERIARRAALEFRNGMYANLGIGMPVLAADYIPKGVSVMLQCENGILGLVRNFN